MKSFIIGLFLSMAVASAPPVVDMEPLNEVGSTLQLSEESNICVQRSIELDKNWPIDNAIAKWNRNGVNFFTTAVHEEDCSAVVLITQTDTEQWFGSVEFYPRRLINVQLSTTAPANRRAAVVCHELGHVLGLPHSLGDGSCMDHNHNNPSPTEEDLILVSNYWDFSKAEHSAKGEK